MSTYEFKKYDGSPVFSLSQRLKTGVPKDFPYDDSDGYIWWRPDWGGGLHRVSVGICLWQDQPAETENKNCPSFQTCLGKCSFVAVCSGVLTLNRGTFSQDTQTENVATCRNSMQRTGLFPCLEDRDTVH